MSACFEEFGAWAWGPKDGLSTPGGGGGLSGSGLMSLLVSSYARRQACLGLGCSYACPGPRSGVSSHACGPPPGPALPMLMGPVASHPMLMARGALRQLAFRSSGREGVGPLACLFVGEGRPFSCLPGRRGAITASPL